MHSNILHFLVNVKCIVMLGDITTHIKEITTKKEGESNKIQACLIYKNESDAKPPHILITLAL